MKVVTVALATTVLVLVATASVSSYFYLETSKSLSAANQKVGQFQAELATLQAQIDSLSAQKPAGSGSTSGISAQLADVSNLLRSLKNAQNSTTFNTEASALQAELNNLQMVESGCGGSTPVSQRPVGNATPVLLMQPSTTAAICVTYKASWSDDESRFNSTVLSQSFWLQSGSYVFRMLIIKNNSVSHSFTITPSPESITPSQYVGYVTVMYRVSALQNSTGFYDQSAPYGYCGDIPMAVGYSASKLNGSDFPPRPPVHSCIAVPYSPISVGVSGMGVAYVDIPPSRAYLSSIVGSCWESGPHYSGYAPCLTFKRSEAYVFNCGASATSPSGCAAHVGTATVGFNLTVWYPIANQTMPWANCAYVLGGDTYKYFGSCIQTSSNSFIFSD